jgi:hypothetical protein
MTETGLPVKLVGDELSPMEYDHPKGDHIIVHMFLMQSKDDSKIKPEFEGDKIVWVSYKELCDKLTYENTKTYFASVLERVEKSIEGLRA